VTLPSSLLVLALWPAVAGPPSRGDALAYRVVDYDVALELDREKKTVTGHERVQLRAFESTERVVFPRNGLRVTAVRAETGEALVPVDAGERLEVALPKPLRRGRTTSLTFDYEAVAPRGVVFHDDAVYTSFDTCHWMVCRDRPDDKATLTLALTVPDGLTAVANGVPVAKRRPRPGFTQHVFRESVPSAPYLFGFVVGELTRTARMVGGVRFEYFARGLPAARRDQLFADDARMLAFFAEKAGRPLPQPFYGQVVVDGDVAQEMSSFSVLGRAVLEPRLATPSEDWAVAHELAHQYWGNLVTCADWSHFWLNEGLTTFMTAAWKEQRWGRAAYDRELELAQKRWRAAVDAGFDVPLAFAGEYPSLHIKRAITYSKALVFLDRLRAAVGDEAFWRALRTYTRKFAGRNAVSLDFQNAFGAAGQATVAPLFKSWVFGEGPAAPARAPAAP
jgi:aminopeptidase N